MLLSDYDYQLPKELIATHPNQSRGNSRMLVFDNGKISDNYFSEVSSILQKGDVLVLNNTKVIPARIPMKKSTGGKAEILITKPQGTEDPTLEMIDKGKSTWEAIIGGKRIKQGDSLDFFDNEIALSALILEKKGFNAKVELIFNPTKTLAKVLEECGQIPLPPYMEREALESDKMDYQTVFAKYEGSVAAPTASLHFTDVIMESIRKKGIEIIELTLHVGPGTFLPVETEDPTKHDMHSESISISSEALKKIAKAKEDGKRIIASGTTSMRSLESWALAALKQSENEKERLENSIKYIVDQWDNKLFNNENIKLHDIPEKLVQLAKGNSTVNGETKLMIMPGHRFLLCNGLITNFHLPKSTLLMLVSAFIGKENMDNIYNHAIKQEYRFLSYGDASLLFRE
ncbi:MAG: S-adenosylmethionine:tRNA ribosyltransferase-isomerase [Candidatus Kapaibacteriales bacterium]